MVSLKAFCSKVNAGGSFYELIRFVLVGGGATLVDLIVTLLLLFVIGGIHANVVTTIAFFVAFIVSYIGHRYFTFKSNGNVLYFFALSFSMLLLRNLLVFLMVTYMSGLTYALLSKIGVALFVTEGFLNLVPIVIAMVIVTIITYVISKFFVFKSR